MNDITRTHVESIPTSLTLQSYALQGETPEGEKIAVSSTRRVFTLGSNPECDLMVTDPTVSRLHARIIVDPRGHCIRDENSKNGVRVNGIRVREAWLPANCRLQLGRVELDFSLEGEAVEIPFSPRGSFGGLIGESLAIREVFAALERIAPRDVTLLLEGESGTGKELAARAVHAHSARSDGPFVVFDCSATPRNLIESELFGHVRGAFTGAERDRKGAMEQAQGGTLFLDEVGELPLDMQPRLLRALETRDYKPVGSTERKTTDARIVAATNRRLRAEVEHGNFREDLFYRLAVICIELPSLSERVGDIPMLTEHFLAEFSGEGRPAQVAWSTMEKLKRHSWPGNVRELRNFVERAVLLSDGDRIETQYMDEEPPSDESPESPLDALIDVNRPFKVVRDERADAFARAYWVEMLRQCGGNISEASRRGGLHRKSLEYALKKLDISARDVLSEENQ